MRITDFTARLDINNLIRRSVFLCAAMAFLLPGTAVGCFNEWRQYNANGNWLTHSPCFTESIAAIVADAENNFPGNTVAVTQLGVTAGIDYIRIVVSPNGANAVFDAPVTILCNTPDGATLGLPSCASPSAYPKLTGDCGCKNSTSALVPSPSAGDPIDIASGNVFYSYTDYETAGPNKLSFIRYYNSAEPWTVNASTLGPNWRTNYDRYLTISSGAVVAERPDGQILNFSGSSATGWAPDSDVDLRLTQVGSGVGATWTLLDNNDSTETYVQKTANLAFLTSVTARNGYTQSLSYNSSNQLTSVTDTYNRTLTIISPTNSPISSVSTPDGLVISFSYIAASNNGVLSQVTYSTNPRTSQQYSYTDPFSLTSIMDENSQTHATWTYDSYGRGLTSQLGTGANLTTVAYNDTDGSRTVTDLLGITSTYTFTMVQGVPKVTQVSRAATSTTAAATRAFTYDSNGFLASATDWNGNLTSYVNSAFGRPTVIDEAVGTSAARTTTIIYDSMFARLPDSITTTGVTTAFTYDSNGNPLTKTSTDTTTVASPYPTNGQARTWKYTWASSLLASVQGPRTDAAELTTFGYDSSGTLTSVTNALGQITRVTQHMPGGRPQTIVDANGVTTNLAYDARLRLISSALGTTAGVLTTMYAYDAAGNLITVTLPDGSGFTNSYDTAHRLTRITDFLAQSISFTLDALGDRTQTNLANPSGVVQGKHSASFDAIGRISQDIGGMGQATVYTYDSSGNALSVTDPLTHQAQQTFDALNRPVTTTDPAGKVTSVAYDTHDRPVSVTDANGGTTLYTYNGFGDLIQQVSAATGTTVYHYDPAGNLVQRVDARGIIANYTYDALDRVVTTVYPGNTAENITHTYDETGHGFGTGRLTSVSDAAGTLSRSYDELGDIISERRVQAGATLLTTYGYNAAQRISSIGYPSGWTVTYARDVMGRVTGISTQAPGSKTGPSSVVSGISYQPFGPPNALTFGNGVKESRSFDADYRETLRSDSGNALFQKLAYAYDLADNVSSITDSVTAGNSQTFGYDTLNRLTSAGGGYGSLGYTYDAIGNRVSDSSSMSSSGLDGLGTINSLTYNQAGRVSAVIGGSQQAAGYSYDAFGHRLARTGSNAGLYQYDSGGHLIEETDGQGNPQADYIYLGDQPIATIAPGGSHVYFLHDDRLGTPQMATDNNQTVQWQASYQPFGATGTGVGLIAQDLRLPGQEYDSVTGWNHNGFRDYVPNLGHYLESDPIGLSGGLNTYLYAIANPLKFTDRYGTSCGSLFSLNCGAEAVINAYDSPPNQSTASADQAADAGISRYNKGAATLQLAGRAANAGVLEISPIPLPSTLEEGAGYIIQTIAVDKARQSPAPQLPASSQCKK